MILIEIEDLAKFRPIIAQILDEFASDYIWKLTIMIDDGLRIKVNEGTWSPPVPIRTVS